MALAESTADQVRAIATASEEQSATSEEIARSVSEINSIALETSRAMQEATHAVGELAQQNTNLVKLMDDLKRS